MDITQIIFLIFVALIAYQLLEPLLFGLLLAGMVWYLLQTQEGFINYGYGYSGPYSSLETPGYGGDPTYCQDCSQQSSADPSFCLSCINCDYVDGLCVQRPGYPNVGPYSTFSNLWNSYLYPYTTFGHNFWGLF